MRAARAAVLGVVVALLSTGCAWMVEPVHDDGGLSLTGTAKELSRGATNVGLCWLEIPQDIQERLSDNQPGEPFPILAGSVDLVLGTVFGAVNGVRRGVGGLFEVVLSPFPPYDPLLTPPLPPYLKPKPTEETAEHPEAEAAEDAPEAAAPEAAAADAGA